MRMQPAKTENARCRTSTTGSEQKVTKCYGTRQKHESSQILRCKDRGKVPVIAKMRASKAETVSEWPRNLSFTWSSRIGSSIEGSSLWRRAMSIPIAVRLQPHMKQMNHLNHKTGGLKRTCHDRSKLHKRNLEQIFQACHEEIEGWLLQEVQKLLEGSAFLYVSSCVWITKAFHECHQSNDLQESCLHFCVSKHRRQHATCLNNCTWHERAGNADAGTKIERSARASR